MNSQTEIINFIRQEKYNEAEETFMRTPIFDYSQKNPLIKYESFEFYETKKKNPIFLRVLLNYISLINLLYDQQLFPIQEILIKFCAKFTYEEKSKESIKLILMAKTSTEVYNIYFQQGKNIFKDCRCKIEDIDEKDDDIKGIGYTFQELGKIFVNDYVIGTNKGIELPNILFYIKSTEETQKLLNTVISVPKDIKLDINEIVDKSGITEFDHIIKLNQDLTINVNNPYFRYIKQIKTNEKNSPVEYGELVLKKNYIYILEFKTSFTMNEDVAKLQNLSAEYVKQYNEDQTSNNINNSEFTILYFYNYQENLGYRSFDGFNINLNLWKFLYINPSCQIVPVIKLSSELKQLKKDFEEEKIKIREELAEEKSRNEFLFSKINEKWRFKFGEDILNLDDSFEEKYSQIEIENSFKEKMKTVKNRIGIHTFDDLFKKFEKGMNEFMNVDEKDKLEIDINNKIWKDKIEGEINDDEFKKCFDLLVPCLGSNKASVNFLKIQKYIYNKTQKKNDEMHEIYNYIYSCLFGTRDIKSNASIKSFYKSVTGQSPTLLQNIIKYTFYYDKKRKGKQYYLLTLLKELIYNGNKNTYETMFNLRHKTLFELIFMTIVLINSDCSIYKNGFEYFPRK